MNDGTTTFWSLHLPPLLKVNAPLLTALMLLLLTQISAG